jgi:hypothetical protein
MSKISETSYLTMTRSELIKNIKASEVTGTQVSALKQEDIAVIGQKKKKSVPLLFLLKNLLILPIQKILKQSSLTSAS